MKISKQEVDNVAKLARLNLTEAEKEIYTQQLTDILTYVEKISEINISNIKPTFHPIPMKNIFREDKNIYSLSVGEVLANAPEKKDGYFVVPCIL
jgi:aspartyl-tRNA(Asn)/glutamyl-tRNA(Gln) amidotransferase subunit C